MLFSLIFGIWSQANITGTADITLINSGAECVNAVRLIDIRVDVTGLSGDGGDVGINAFAIALHLDPEYFVAFAFPGSGPIPFEVLRTDPELAGTTAIIVGYAADTQAPNGIYRLARLWVKGPVGPFTVTIDPALSSLGSRAVGGFGPDDIPFTVPGPIMYNLPGTFSLDRATGIAQWQQVDPAFDLTLPDGPVDARDLVKLFNCTTVLPPTH